MKVVKALADVTPTPSILCIGNFDGVHLGHQILLRRQQQLSQEHGVPSVIVTFFPPSKVVFRNKPYLSSEDEKLHLLRAFSPHTVAMLPFSKAYAQTPKEAFLEGLEPLGAKYLIVGDDFRFGYQRSGGLDDLQHVTERLEVFSLEKLEEEVIKSSYIRGLLSAGKVEEARRFLGYSYLVFGTVIAGDKRGRTIGFPTANIAVPEQKALPHGVFAVRVNTQAGHFLGVANVGPRPSYPDHPPALEVHLLNFSGDLYGQEVRVSFEHFLRYQRKFDGLDALKAQLEHDKKVALELLAPAPP